MENYKLDECWRLDCWQIQHLDHRLFHHSRYIHSCCYHKSLFHRGTQNWSYKMLYCSAFGGREQNGLWVTKMMSKSSLDGPTASNSLDVECRYGKCRNMIWRQQPGKWVSWCDEFFFLWLWVSEGKLQWQNKLTVLGSAHIACVCRRPISLIAGANPVMTFLGFL